MWNNTLSFGLDLLISKDAEMKSTKLYTLGYQQLVAEWPRGQGVLVLHWKTSTHRGKLTSCPRCCAVIQQCLPDCIPKCDSVFGEKLLKLLNARFCSNNNCLSRDIFPFSSEIFPLSSQIQLFVGRYLPKSHACNKLRPVWVEKLTPLLLWSYANSLNWERMLLVPSIHVQILASESLMEVNMKVLD